MVEPVEDYFLSIVYDSLGEDVQIYKVLKNANPLSVRSAPPTVLQFTADVEHLNHFSSSEIEAMVSELPKYLNLADDWNPPENQSDIVELHSVRTSAVIG